jgi:hypothetical protein
MLIAVGFLFVVSTLFEKHTSGGGAGGERRRCRVAALEQWQAQRHPDQTAKAASQPTPAGEVLGRVWLRAYHF